jgi:hypothetical protein
MKPGKRRETRKTPGIKIWQRNYYEHIIRKENELNRIREYIQNNPMKWEFDRENPNVGAGFKPAPTTTGTIKTILIAGNCSGLENIFGTTYQ